MFLLGDWSIDFRGMARILKGGGGGDKSPLDLHTARFVSLVVALVSWFTTCFELITSIKFDLNISSSHKMLLVRSTYHKIASLVP